MPFVVYAAPFFSENTLTNVRALLDLPGVQLAIISQDPQEKLAPAYHDRLIDFRQVGDILATADLLAAATALRAAHGTIDHLFSATEQLQVQLAEVRTALGIPGLSVAAAQNFRDKALMKERLRAAGLPCARYQLVEDVAAAQAFASTVGYPLVAKPQAGAGAQATYQVTNDTELAQALEALAPAPGQPVLLEEFITGEEHSFDTWSIRGEPVFYSTTTYLPTPLDAMRNPWIQWAVLLPFDHATTAYDDIRSAAFAALRTLGIDTGVSHMEWFRRADGSIAISEVAARQPGAQITTLMSRAFDFDSMAAWARLLVYSEFTPPTQRYAAGALFLRGHGGAVVRAVHGLAEADQQFGHLITDFKLPVPGQPASPSYEGEGYLVVRAPETATVQHALAELAQLVRVEMGPAEG